ncbi:MAG: hypothetical protein EXR70_13360 [Deltaproteobacteria bacterium]|nr:hypothetical protein [Deltaproteobacteria bacterium]
MFFSGYCFRRAIAWAPLQPAISFAPTLFEIAADHFVHVHEQAKALAMKLFSPNMLQVTSVFSASGLKLNSVVLVAVNGLI